LEFLCEVADDMALGDDVEFESFAVEIRLGFQALRGCMREWGVLTPMDLANWLEAAGFRNISAGDYFGRPPQEFILEGAMRMNGAVANLHAAFVHTAIHLSRNLPGLRAPPAPGGANSNLEFSLAADSCGLAEALGPIRAGPVPGEGQLDIESSNPPGFSNPVLPLPARARSEINGWEAIDHIPIMGCYQSPFVHLEEVPVQHVEAWASVWADIMQYLLDASDAASQCRALKWMLVIHDVLLRLPPRGGRRGRNQTAQRFAAWQVGDWSKLIAWWERDRTAAHHPIGRQRAVDVDKLIDKALRLIGEGDMARAVHLLHSNGLADIGDDRVLRQLREKHPPRKAVVPQSLAQLGEFRRLQVELGPVFRDLDVRGGTGASGFRNSYLKVLAQSFVDPHAAQALALTEQFAELYVNAELPGWFYYLFSSLRMVAPVKAVPADAGMAPDVRPIGIGECLRRAIHKSVIAQMKPSLAEHLWPQQVAIGVAGGLSILIFGVRLVLEVFPGWVVVKIDLRNAYNEICRASVLQRLAEVPHVRDLVPPMWANYLPESMVFIPGEGSATADFSSAEGVQQGEPMAGAGFCVGIHPEVCQLDAELNAVGGMAKFDMDDGYAVGPPEVVFPAVQRFAVAVRALGLELQLGKCKCYSPAGDMENHRDRPPQMQVGHMLDAAGVFCYGIDVGGIPMGDDGYVAAFLDCKAGEAMSKITNINLKLRSRHLQSLFAVTYYCLSPLFQYWLQHCYPEDVRAAAAVVDHGVATTAGFCISSEVCSDVFALRRLRLPARRFGGGLRSLVDVSPAAFLGGICNALPHFLDRQQLDGTQVAGFLPGLAHVMGAGAFDEGSEDTRWRHFLQSGTRTAMAFALHWRTLQLEVGQDIPGPLGSSLESAGASHPRLQRSITEQREAVRFQALDVDIRALPPGDMRRAAWLNVDRFSTCWVSAWPSPTASLSNDEFLEASTNYFGLASPSCSDVVGERIGATRNCVDPHGCRLTTATLPGDGWRTQHDSLKWQIHQDCKDNHGRINTEVYGLFAACIPQEGRRSLEREPVRKRQGLVPDFMVYADIDGAERALLMELKTLHYGTSTYPNAERRCEAVARRARALPAEYAAKAARADRQYCGTADGEVGPVTRRLQRFEPVRGLVFGAWAECSPEVEKLLTWLAKTGAARHWRTMGCLDDTHARGILAWAIRRNWAIAALRENARLKLDRLTYVGNGASIAAHRRSTAHATWCARAAARAWSSATQPGRWS